MSEEKLYTATEAAEMLFVSKSTISRWNRLGVFVGQRTASNRLVYTYAQIQERQEQQERSRQQKLSTGRVDVARGESVKGLTFGKLTVVAEPERGLCECVCDCGTHVTVRRGDLLSGNTSSCGCARTESFVRRYNVDSDGNELPVLELLDLPGHHRTADFTGLVFGKLTVLYLERTYMRKCGKATVIWHCRCECGNETSVDAQALRSGHTKSCGCSWKTNPGRLADLTGRRFGKLVVQYRILEQNYRRFAKWHCLCDCGNECDVISSDLVQGLTSSCGCLKMPRREIFVCECFAEFGLVDSVDYFRQYSYDDLRGVGGRKLTYDFLVCSDGQPVCLIECQGEQHYRPVDWYGGVEKFEQQVEHDVRKHDYAAKIGLPLLEIRPEAKNFADIRTALLTFFYSINFRK